MKNVFDKIMFVLLSLILFSCSQDDAVMNGPYCWHKRVRK